MIYTYDPKQILASFAGVPIVGFAEGTFLVVSRGADAFTVHVGSDGEGARTKSNDKRGTIKFTLMQSSPSNDHFSAMAVADEKANAGVAPFFAADRSGRSLHGATNAWVKKVPDGEYANTLGNRDWVLETENLENFIGGSNPT